MDGDQVVTKLLGVSVGKKGVKPPAAGKGRPRGSRNKFTDLKASFINVYKRLGGDDALLEWAGESSSNKKVFYQMIHTMLPKDVQTEIKQSVMISWQQPPGQIPDAEVITPRLTEPDTHNVTEHD